MNPKRPLVRLHVNKNKIGKNLRNFTSHFMEDMIKKLKKSSTMHKCIEILNHLEFTRFTVYICTF
jgi:hypothetical protein